MVGVDGLDRPLHAVAAAHIHPPATRSAGRWGDLRKSDPLDAIQRKLQRLVEQRRLPQQRGSRPPRLGGRRQKPADHEPAVGKIEHRRVLRGLDSPGRHRQELPRDDRYGSTDASPSRPRQPPAFVGHFATFSSNPWASM